MHTTTKDVIGTNDEARAMGVPIGTHILTSVIEGDGAVALCTALATLSAKVISTQRTDSGGIQVQVAVFVSEPAVAAPASPVVGTPEQQAVAYFVSNGLSQQTAAAQVAKFGVDRVLAQRDKELGDALAKQDKDLNDELASIASTPSTATTLGPKGQGFTSEQLAKFKGK